MATVVRGAAVIDGTGADPLRADVSFEEGRIRTVADGVEPSRGDTVVEADGLTVLPGLIDAHSHFGLVDLGGVGGTPVAVIAARIFQNCDLAIDSGFTTVRDCGGVDGGLARAIDVGLIRGPRLYPSGPILCQTGGHGDLTPPFATHPHGVTVPGLVQTSIVCDGPAEVRVAARTALRRGATQVKVCVSGGVVSLSDRLEDTQFTVEELRAAVEEAEARETYVTAHAHNIRGIRNGLQAGVKCFEHGSFLDAETATALAEAGAWLVPTLAVARLMAEEGESWGLSKDVIPRIHGIEEAMTRAVKLAYDAGVLMGSGSDLIGPAQTRRGLELTLKARIIGPLAAIVSATASNARIIGASDTLGTLERGKIADLIAIAGDPLVDPEVFDDPARIVLVVKDGIVLKDTRG
jgi:imidazolonepropionase-like amidohydrolase